MMTKKELIKELECFDDDMEIVMKPRTIVDTDVEEIIRVDARKMKSRYSENDKIVLVLESDGIIGSTMSLDWLFSSENLISFS